MFPAASRTARVSAATCLLMLLLACTESNAPRPQSRDLRASAETDVRAAVENFKSANSQRDVERRTLWTALANLPISQDAVDVADRIDAADSGDLTVQYGEFRQVVTDGKGHFTSAPQEFITSWRRQPDGSWKISASMASVASVASVEA